MQGGNFILEWEGGELVQMMNNASFATALIMLFMVIITASVGWFFYSSKTGYRAIFLAGYNLATEEERSLYDEKALCKYTGKQFLLMALLLLIGAILGFIIFGVEVVSDTIIAYGGFIVGIGGFLLIFCHYAYVRYRKMDMFLKEEQKEEQNHKD